MRRQAGVSNLQEQLQEERENRKFYEDKLRDTDLKIKRIKDQIMFECPHKNTSRWGSYEIICKDCGKTWDS